MRRDAGWCHWRPTVYVVAPAVRLDVGWGMWEPTTYLFLADDTEQPLIGVEEAEDTDLDDFDHIDDFPSGELIWV